MKKWAYIFGGFLLGAVVAVSSQSAFAEIQSSVNGKEVVGTTTEQKVDDTTKTTSKVVINEKGLITYDVAGTKRVALGINDVANMSGFAYYDPAGKIKGQIYSVPSGFHIVADDELLIHSFGKTVIQGDVVFEGDVKFKGTVDFSEAQVKGLK